MSKKCYKCGLEKDLNDFAVCNRNIDGLQYMCKECFKLTMKNYRTTVKGFLYDLTSNTYYRKNRISELSYDFIYNLHLKQEGKCAISGYPYVLTKNSHYQCSIERIDDDKDYLEDNVCLVLLEFNHARKWTVDKWKTAILLSEIPSVDNLYNSLLSYKPKVRGNPRKTEKKDNLIRCNYCNIFKDTSDFSKNRKSECKDCFCLRQKEKYHTVRGIIGNIMRAIKTRHKYMLNREKYEKTPYNNSFDVPITRDYLYELLLSQNGRCAYSNIPLSIENDWHISIERLNTNGGYFCGNVVFVCFEFNKIDNTSTSKYCSESTGWSKEKFSTLKKYYKNEKFI